MSEREQHDDAEPQALPNLIAGLKRLHTERVFVPSSLDKAVLSEAKKRLTKRSREAVWWRPMLPWAAVAASVVFALWLARTMNESPSVAGNFAHEDINYDGTVDILDAFTLARAIGSGGMLDTRWDLTGDGKIDTSDANAIAARAVSLMPAATAPRRSATSGLRTGSGIFGTFEPRAVLRQTRRVDAGDDSLIRKDDRS